MHSLRNLAVIFDGKSQYGLAICHPEARGYFLNHLTGVHFGIRQCCFFSLSNECQSAPHFVHNFDVSLALCSQFVLAGNLSAVCLQVCFEGRKRPCF